MVRRAVSGWLTSLSEGGAWGMVEVIDIERLSLSHNQGTDTTGTIEMRSTTSFISNRTKRIRRIRLMYPLPHVDDVNQCTESPKEGRYGVFPQVYNVYQRGLLWAVSPRWSVPQHLLISARWWAVIDRNTSRISRSAEENTNQIARTPEIVSRMVAIMQCY